MNMYNKQSNPKENNVILILRGQLLILLIIIVSHIGWTCIFLLVIKGKAHIHTKEKKTKFKAFTNFACNSLEFSLQIIFKSFFFYIY